MQQESLELCRQQRGMGMSGKEGVRASRAKLGRTTWLNVSPGLT